MRIVTATLIKGKTDDGLVECFDDVLLGKKYQVDADSIRMEEGYNYIKNKEWRREVVNDVEENGAWLPTEILDIEL